MSDLRARFRQSHSSNDKPQTDSAALSAMTGLPERVTITVDFGDGTAIYEGTLSLFGKDKRRVGYLMNGHDDVDGIRWRVNGQTMIAGDAGKLTEDERDTVRA